MSDERKGKPSASSVYRIAHCPRSHRMELQYGVDESSEVADEGTEIHGGISTDDIEHLDEDKQEIASRLKKMERDQIDRFLRDLKVKDPGAPWKSGREERLWAADKYSAKLDFYYIPYWKDALILEYKTGYNQVTRAHKNYQIRTQAICLWKEHPQLNRIRAGIAAFRFREDCSITEYTRANLLQAEREINFLLWRSEQEDAELIPGEWCTYCKAKGVCPAAAVQALIPVPAVPSDVKVTDEQIQSSVAALDISQLAFINARRSLADKIFTAVANRLRNFDDADLAKVGLVLRENTRANIQDLGAALKEFVSLGLLKKDECVKCCDLVVGRVAELAVPRIMESGVPTKKEALKRLKNTLEPFTTKITCAPIIAKRKEDNAEK